MDNEKAVDCVSCSDVRRAIREANARMQMQLKEDEEFILQGSVQPEYIDLNKPRKFTGEIEPEPEKLHNVYGEPIEYIKLGAPTKSDVEALEIKYKPKGIKLDKSETYLEPDAVSATKAVLEKWWELQRAEKAEKAEAKNMKQSKIRGLVVWWIDVGQAGSELSQMIVDSCRKEVEGKCPTDWKNVFLPVREGGSRVEQVVFDAE